MREFTWIIDLILYKGTGRNDNVDVTTYDRSISPERDVFSFRHPLYLSFSAPVGNALLSLIPSSNENKTKKKHRKKVLALLSYLHSLPRLFLVCI